MSARLQHWLLPHKGNQHRPILLQSRGFLLISMVVGLWYLVLLAALHLPQLHQILGYGSQITVPQVLTETNQQRQSQNLPPLTIDPKLSQAALAKAQDMFADQYWSHTAPDGTQPWDFIKKSGYTYSIAGENLAKNFTQTNTMIAAWMSSPTHKANLISPSYTNTGIAVLEGELDGVETTLVVQMFGKPESAVITRENPIVNNAADSTATTNNDSVGLIAGETDMINTADDVRENPSDPTALEQPLLPEGSATSLSLRPLATPLAAYRIGILALLGFMIAVLGHDLWLAKQQQLQRQAGRNLAHIVVIVAVIITLVLAQTGKLL